MRNRKVTRVMYNLLRGLELMVVCNIGISLVLCDDDSLTIIILIKPAFSIVNDQLSTHASYLPP